VLIRVVIALFLLFTMYVVGGKLLRATDTLAALAALDQSYLVPIVLLGGLVYYVLKALRWHYYLGVAGIRVPLRRSLAAYLAGNWFVFTPAGELMRAYLLGAGTRFSRVAPTVMVQALVDFASLALMATVVVPFYPALAPVVLPVTVPLLATLPVVAAPPLRRYGSNWWLLKRLVSGKRQALAADVGRLLSPGAIAIGLLMGVPTVLAGASALYLTGVALEVPAWHPGYALSVYSMMLIAGGASPLPQGLGVTEGTGTLILGYLGIDAARALAVILLFRAIVLGFSAALGLLAFLALRLTVPELAQTPVGGVGDDALAGSDDGLPTPV
jgi:uncharacterized membrane protein YbhN (UPF0104 family)